MSSDVARNAPNLHSLILLAMTASVICLVEKVDRGPATGCLLISIYVDLR